MRLLLRLMGVGILSSLPSFSSVEPNHPNMMLIFADDLGYGDLGCYGATKVKTPSIDQLARKRRLFSDAHSASAVCTPSRYALLTDEYPFRCGKGGTWGPLSHSAGLTIDAKRQTLGQVFEDAGYATTCIGKWHLGFGKDKSLEKNGLTEKTLVIFAGDNEPIYDDGYPDGTTVSTSSQEVDRGHDASGIWRGGKGQIWEEGGLRHSLK